MVIDVPENAVRCQLILWAHPWSGYTNIYVDDNMVCGVDLYAHVGGCRRVTIGLDSNTEISIHSPGIKCSNSKGEEVIFVRSVFAIDSD